jgi:predicted metal-binding membrane protein
MGCGAQSVDRYNGDARGLAPRRFRVSCCWVLMALLFVAGVMNLPMKTA